MAKTGFRYIILFFVLAFIFFACGGILNYIFGAVFFVLTLFCFYFFRDPDRTVRVDEKKILSPADGTIFEISEIEEPLFIKGKAKIIKIFLSVFNVHLQRSPVAGDVKFLRTQNGLFLPANHKNASDENQQNLIGIAGGKIQVLIRQIAGIIARKCELWVGLNQKINQGDKIGIIHFGSQVDIYIPREIEIKIKIGDKVKAGVTVIGERPEAGRP